MEVAAIAVSVVAFVKTIARAESAVVSSSGVDHREPH